MSQNETKSSGNAKSAGAASSRGTRYAVIALVAVALFAVSYGIAAARSGSSASAASSGSGVAVAAGSAAAAAGGSGSAGAAGGSSPACACCGGSSASSAPIEGTAQLQGDVQRIDVDLSSGSYNPNTIILKAGIPAEITFGQSNGCTAQVISQDLGFSEDLTQGPRTVKLAALSAGEYQFSCGMQMVFGKVVVQ